MKAMVKVSVAAVALAFGAAAYADGVTMYGNIDVGVMSASNACKSANANGCTATGSAVALQGSQMQANDFGIKGNESLGNGLTAGFDLEGGFNLANGSLGVAGGNATTINPGVPGNTSLGSYAGGIFSRTAEVSLSGDWGSVAAGNQVDPALIASASTEPRGLTYSLSMLDAWILTSAVSNSTGSNLASTLATGSVFDNNSVSYTYSANGLYVGALYGFGGIAGSQSASAQTSVGASYTIDNFAVSGSFARNNQVGVNAGSSINGSQIADFGLGYTYGAWAIRAQYGDFRDYAAGSGALADEFKVFGVGVDYNTSVANKLNLSFYDGKNDASATNNRTQELAFMDNYALSKRTSVYGQVATMKLDANAGLIGSAMGGIFTPVGLTAVSSVNGSPSVRTTYLGVGVTHAF